MNEYLARLMNDRSGGIAPLLAAAAAASLAKGLNRLDISLRIFTHIQIQTIKKLGPGLMIRRSSLPWIYNIIDIS